LIEPFERWALDFVKTVNPPSKQKVYILVCSNYVTEWVEMKALPKATKLIVATFLYDEILFVLEFLRKKSLIKDLSSLPNSFKALCNKSRLNIG